MIIMICGKSGCVPNEDRAGPRMGPTHIHHSLPCRLLHCVNLHIYKYSISYINMFEYFCHVSYPESKKGGLSGAFKIKRACCTAVQWLSIWYLPASWLVNSAVWSVQRAVGICLLLTCQLVNFASCSVHCAVGSVECAVCSMQCAVGICLLLSVGQFWSVQCAVCSWYLAASQLVECGASALMSDHWDHTEAWQVQVITLALWNSSSIQGRLTLLVCQEGKYKWKCKYKYLLRNTNTQWITHK